MAQRAIRPLRRQNGACGAKTAPAPRGISGLHKRASRRVSRIAKVSRPARRRARAAGTASPDSPRYRQRRLHCNSGVPEQREQSVNSLLKNRRRVPGARDTSAARHEGRRISVADDRRVTPPMQMARDSGAG